MKIYLADLVYNTIKTNYVAPLNIGCIAAYLKNKCPEAEIKLFKYPTDLEKAIREEAPDVLGLSNYSWNTRLNSVFINLVKKLNPKALAVLGGPNIRLEPNDLEAFLTKRPEVDYYIPLEGEEPFGALIKEIMNGDNRPTPEGCATIKNGFHYHPVDFKKKPKEIEFPSPYLSGWLDQFLNDPKMIPLMESNRGCPFSCVYCAWGIANLSRVRVRPIEMVFEELDYIAEHCAGQPFWIFCDANFGIFPRDAAIAKKIREIRDKKGYPSSVELWHSKNTGKINIEIEEILENNTGYIAIQSADPVVLKNSGRGLINVNSIKEQIDYYKRKNLDVKTDILIGLPGESAASHLKTLEESFKMGFDVIEPVNIRLLPGSLYESDEYRKKYGVKTKFRPIFGAYGVYDSEPVFEIEESLRATKDMTEEELDEFKVLHWLIYFTWNSAIFKPILKMAHEQGANPAKVLHKLARSTNPLLKKTFDFFRKESREEWFDTADEMIKFYENNKNFHDLVDNFVKLNFKYIAIFYQDHNLFSALSEELTRIIEEELKKIGSFDELLMEQVLDIMDLLICKDFWRKEFSVRRKYPGRVVSLAVKNPGLINKESVEVEIYRPKEFVYFCNFYLNEKNKQDCSLKSIIRFLEIPGALKTLSNKIKVVDGV